MSLHTIKLKNASTMSLSTPDKNIILMGHWANILTIFKSRIISKLDPCVVSWQVL